MMRKREPVNNSSRKVPFQNRGGIVIGVCAIAVVMAGAFWFRSFIISAKPDESSVAVIVEEVSSQGKIVENIEEPRVNQMAEELQREIALSREQITGREPPKTDWSWLEESVLGTDDWEAAYGSAMEYIRGANVKQKEALRLLQEVLNSNPPRQIELHVRLLMGSRLTILYDPRLGEESRDAEALHWYRSMLSDFEDWPMHHDLMIAKLHYADLVASQNGFSGIEKAKKLCWEVIQIPEEDLIFDDPERTRYNIDQIQVAQGQTSRARETMRDPQRLQKRIEELNQRHRETLFRVREERIASLRKSASRSLAYKQHTKGVSITVTIRRLKELKKQRPNDQVFQDVINARIEYFEKQLKDNPDRS